MSIEHRIGDSSVTLEEICRRLETTALNSVRKVLPDKAILQACCDAGHTYRRRLITPIVTVLHMILAAAWPEESFAASWHILWNSMVGGFSVAAGCSPRLASVTKARMRLPLAVWKEIFEWLSGQAQKLSEGFDKWRGHRVVLLDGTCVSMENEPGLFKAFGRCNTRHGQAKYPLARLVTVALANTMTVIGYSFGSYRCGETTLAKGLLKVLGKGDLLVADRCFAGANLYCHYLSGGLEFLTRVHQRLKVSRLRCVAFHGPGDFLARLKINKAHRKDDPKLPAFITVRMICVRMRVRGKCRETFLVTSLLAADRYPAQEIAKLYAHRWRIETLFRQLKINMSADVLRSKTVEGIRKEIAARFVALNVVRMIILEAAIEHNADPLRISFTHATRAVIAFAQVMCMASVWKLPIIYKAMLREIAERIVPERPGRIEPRAVMREPKHYPSLRTTRKAWRQENTLRRVNRFLKPLGVR